MLSSLIIFWHKSFFLSLTAFKKYILINLTLNDFCLDSKSRFFSMKCYETAFASDSNHPLTQCGNKSFPHTRILHSYKEKKSLCDIQSFIKVKDTPPCITTGLWVISIWSFNPDHWWLCLHTTGDQSPNPLYPGDTSCRHRPWC